VLIENLLPDENVVIAGMMSGTSFDGVDVAVVDVRGVFTSMNYKVLELCFHPYSEDLKKKLRRFISSPDMSLLAEIDLEVAKSYVEAIKSCRKFNFVEAVSMHGQTVWHVPKKISVQIGNADFVAIQTGKPVISDFRSKDIAAGGEGAPLTPYVDYCVFSRSGKRIALNNIGGISNVTVITEKFEDLLAFDTGPGNALIDIAVKKFFDMDLDKDGKIALSGKVDKDVAKRVFEEDEYMKIPPPKSTGKEYYNEKFLKRFYDIKGPQDIVATVTYYTAFTIFKSYEMFIFPKTDVRAIYLSGGGAKNPALLKHLKDLFLRRNVKVFRFHEKFSDFKEAIWFAILGNEFLKGHFSNAPSVTGASSKVTLGKLSVPW
jgi:anhydro-N-acetylmuramic acid kinase